MAPRTPPNDLSAPISTFQVVVDQFTSTHLGVVTGTTGFITAFSVSPSPVPLPAAWPLFATGLGALGLLGWRRKKKLAA
jgi:PEP-CTERM motif-containing protein